MQQDQMVVQVLDLGTSILVSIAAVLIYIPILGIKVSLFLASIHYFCFLDDSHSDYGKMKSQCSFDLYFLDG
jgi:hypothetical protein